MTADWIGLSGLSITERLFMIGGAALGLWSYMSLKALFGGLIRQLPPRGAKPKPKAKAKAKKKPARKRGR